MPSSGCGASVLQPLVAVEPRYLVAILEDQKLGSKVIVFCSTKSRCETLSNQLTQRKPKFAAVPIHEGTSQDERETILNMFLSGRPPILVATPHATMARKSKREFGSNFGNQYRRLSTQEHI
jgi:superfamily II DNA/RNA helicase